MTYLAIVDDGSLADFLEEHPEAADEVGFLHLYFAGERGVRPADSFSDRALHDLARSMMSRHCDIHTRRLWIGCSWDILHWLLSPERRSGTVDGSDPGTRAIRCDQPLHPLAVATQGIPIRYLPALEVAQVASWISGITADRFREIYARLAREASAVYKFSPQDAAAASEEVCRRFLLLREFYWIAAGHEEAVLAVLD